MIVGEICFYSAYYAESKGKYPTDEECIFWMLTDSTVCDTLEKSGYVDKEGYPDISLHNFRELKIKYYKLWSEASRTDVARMYFDELIPTALVMQREVLAAIKDSNFRDTKLLKEWRSVSSLLIDVLGLKAPQQVEIGMTKTESVSIDSIHMAMEKARELQEKVLLEADIVSEE